MMTNVNHGFSLVSAGPFVPFKHLYLLSQT